VTYQRLKPRSHYEDLYDRSTVEQCRINEAVLNKAFKEMEQTLPPSEFQEKQSGWYILYSRLYFYSVETLAALRWLGREALVDKAMEYDGQKDKRLHESKASKIPLCPNCTKELKEIHKYYMYREDASIKSDEQDILFMFECNMCKQRSACWQDGTQWEGPKISCSKCNSSMTVIHEEEGKIVKSSYTCANCGHSYEEKLDITKMAETSGTESDPKYEIDLKRYRFDDEVMKRYHAKGKHLERLNHLFADATERIENADAYDAVKSLKQLKIAQLLDLLQPLSEQNGYRQFKLGEPEISQFVAISLSCLDERPERSEHNSIKDLKKLIETVLEDTNWRLITNGISYRLGYLSGRIRAYEGEEQLKKLVAKPADSAQSPYERLVLALSDEEFNKLNLPEVLPVISEFTTIDSRNLEGGSKRDKALILNVKFHNDLRIIIPARENDESVPAVIRNFDFNIVHEQDFRYPKKSKYNTQSSKK